MSWGYGAIEEGRVEEVSLDGQLKARVRLHRHSDSVVCRVLVLDAGPEQRGVAVALRPGDEVAVALAVPGRVAEGGFILGRLEIDGAPPNDGFRLRMRDGEPVELETPGARVTLETDGRVRIAAETVEIIDGATGAPLPATDSMVHGEGVDTLTGATYFALGSTTLRLRAER